MLHASWFSVLRDSRINAFQLICLSTEPNNFPDESAGPQTLPTEQGKVQEGLLAEQGRTPWNQTTEEDNTAELFRSYRLEVQQSQQK